MYSKYYLYNSNIIIYIIYSIYNILFNEESNYIFNNISLQHIFTNSNALFYFFYNNVFIHKMKVEDVKCIGNANDSTFIRFESNEKTNLLEIDDLNIKNVFSHGSFITFEGPSNQLILKNSNIYYSNFYGPFLKKKSEKVKRKNIINFKKNIF